MDSLLIVAILGGVILGFFWLELYVYGLYKLGRAIATRFRTRPVPTLAVITVASLAITVPVLFVPCDVVWKATLVFGLFIMHAQAVAAGFWGGMEIGRHLDEKVWEKRTEEWLSEWEDPVPKGLGDDSE